MKHQRNGHTGRDHYHSGNTSNLLPLDQVLSPRADVWIYLCVSSSVGIASLARAHTRYNQDAVNMQTQQTKMGAYAIISITLLSLNAAIALAVGVAYRYHPSLIVLTRPMNLVMSLEFLLAAMALLNWILCMFFCNSPNDAAFQIMMDMPLSQMNANFFYSHWVTGILSLYLVSDLCTGNNRGGVISITAATSIHSTKNQTMGRLWMLLLFSSILLLSFSIMLQVGPSCMGELMHNSSYCASTMTALSVSILGMLLCFSWAISIRARRDSSSLDKFERVLALAILIGYACNAGITTSPGGSGTNVGNVYVASWLALILASILNVSYLRLHFTSRSCDENVPSSNYNGSKREQLDAMGKNSQNGQDLDGNEEFDEEYDGQYGDMASHVFH